MVTRRKKTVQSIRLDYYVDGMTHRVRVFYRSVAVRFHSSDL